MSKKIIKGYKILRKIGQGGMAAIYLAEHIATKEQVAMKVLLSHIASDRDYVLRFLHEVRANKKLDHPNIVKIIDCDEVKGHYFMAMEFIDGMTLQDLLQTVHILPYEVALYIFREIIKGLQFSHSKKIIHRDIKPSNILISLSGKVKISDFGISKMSDFTKLTQTGSVLGTPAYMSPEQAIGKHVDPRSDLFSAGIMLYEMTLGENPFYSENSSTTILNIMSKTPPSPFELNPTVSPILEMLIEKLIAKDVDERYSSANEIIESINAYENEGKITILSQEEFQRFINNPVEQSRLFSHNKAEKLISNAEELLKKGPETYNRAIWEFYKATSLEPENDDAKQRFRKLCSERGYNLTPHKTNKIKEIEKTLKEDPNNVPLLMQLAKLNRLENNFFEVIKYFKKLKKLSPNDAYLQGQIDSLFNDKTLMREVTAAVWINQNAPTTQQPIAGKSQYMKKTMPQINLTVVKSPPKKKSNKKIILSIIVFLFAIPIFWGMNKFFKTMSKASHKVPSSSNEENLNLHFNDIRTSEIPSGALTMYQKAEKAFQNKDFSSARILFNKFHKQFPDQLQKHIFLRLIVIEENLLHYDETLNDIEQLLRLNPEPLFNIFARMERAKIFSLQKNYYDAEMEYDDVISQLDEVSEIGFRVQCLLDYGYFLKSRENYEKAFEMTEQIMNDYQGIKFHLEARKLRAKLFLAKGTTSKAIHEYKLILKNLSPEDENYEKISDTIKKLRADENN